MKGPPLEGLVWAAIPFALYALVLRHLWFNAPVWDDYDAILESTMRLMDASTLQEWLRLAVVQHNEHRIALARLVAWAMGSVSGRIEFPLLVLAGNLSLAGILVLAWAQFRRDVAPPLFLAAAFLLLQWSYYEAALLAMTAISNIGVIFVAFACLFLATRGGPVSLVSAALLGVIAAGTQANGLLALPMAAAACALAGMRSRALLFAAMTVAICALYFWGYSRPAHHPSPMAALADPLGAVQLFLIVIGGIVPGRWAPIPVGAALLGVLAWLTRRGLWRSHPTACLWIGFLLISAAAAAAGRIGFGVFNASRYALYSSCLVMLVFLCVCSVARPWSRRAVGSAIAGAAAVSLGVSLASWQGARAFSLDGHLLARAVPAAEGMAEPRYFGVLHPDLDLANRILNAAATRGLYWPPEAVIYPFTLRTLSTIPASAPHAGHVDAVRIEGHRLVILGWTHLSALVPQRTLALVPAGNPTAVRVAASDRPDVAKSTGAAHLVFSGFRLEADYASAADARSAAEGMSVVVEAPGYPPAVLPLTPAPRSR